MNSQRTCCRNGCRGLAQMQLNPDPVQIKDNGITKVYTCDSCGSNLFVHMIKS
jgi:hypothetical protein